MVTGKIGKMRKSFWRQIKHSISILLFLSLVIVGKTEANGFFLDKALGVTSLANGQVLVVDAGGSDWSNNGSEIFGFKETGEIIWHYKGELVFAHSINLLKSKNYLITDTGNDRLLEVNLAGEVVWTSELWSNTKLDYPNEAEELSDGVYLVTDRNNDRVIEIDRNGEILWSFEDLDRPHNADKLESGNYLISDSENNRVIEVNKNREVVWEWNEGLNWPRDVDLMKNKNLLVTDSRNNRVVIINRKGEISWSFEDLYWPYEADELENGNILIADSQNRRVIEVNKEKRIVKELSLREGRNLEDNFLNGGFETEGIFVTEIKEQEEGGRMDVNRLFEGRTAKNWIPGVQVAENEGELSLDRETKKKGEQSGRINFEGQGHIFWLQQFKATLGKWELTGWIKTNSQERRGRGARFEVWLENEKGAFLTKPVMSEKISGKKDWKRMKVVVDIPEEARVVQIRALFDDTGTAWFDELEWKRMTWWEVWGRWFVIGFGIMGVARLAQKKRG